MRRLIFIIGIAWFFYGCLHGGKADFARLELINGTNYSIEIKGYDKYFDYETQRVGIIPLRINIPLIDNGSNWVSEKQKISHGEHFQTKEAFADSDSIVILFDRKRIYYETLGSRLSRRILGIPYGLPSDSHRFPYSNFEIIKEDKRDYIYRYTITQEEYDLATELTD